MAGRITKQLQREQRAVAETLRDLRTRAGLTQKELADELGWPLTTIQRCEACERRIAVQELIPLARVLGTTPERFIRAVLRRL